MEEIEIYTPYVKLQQALKLADVLESGGEAKIYLMEHEVKVNGVVARERGKKVHPGDLVEYPGGAFRVKAQEN